MLLPRPYEDEAAGSIIARACWRTGLSVVSLLKSVLEVRRTRLSFLLPGAFQRLALLTGMGPREFLMRHTAFPYATAFLPWKTYQTVEAAVLTEAADQALAQFAHIVSQGAANRRLCPQCLLDDRKLLGESYWRRSHLLPAVWVCRHHGTPLRTVEIGPTHRYAQPHQLKLPPRCFIESLQAPYLLPVLVKVATASAALLQPDAGRLEQTAAHYLKQAEARGHASASLQVVGRSLAAAIRSTYGDVLLREVGCSLEQKAASPWPALMVRPQSNRTFAPVKHVLLAAYFDHTAPMPASASMGSAEPAVSTPAPSSHPG